jgi:hypothetical protein
LQTPLKERIGGERDGDFTDNFIVRLLVLGEKKSKKIIVMIICAGEGLQTSVGPGI